MICELSNLISTFSSFMSSTSTKLRAAAGADRSREETALAALPVTMKSTGQVSNALTASEAATDVNATSAAVESLTNEAASGPTFYLQLMSLPVEARVRTEWSRLRSAHVEVLGNLDADVVRADLDDRGVWYRLQAGPLASLSLATEACSRLADGNQDCLVVKR